mgnify:CR=1 FL=1
MQDMWTPVPVLHNLSPGDAITSFHPLVSLNLLTFSLEVSNVVVPMYTPKLFLCNVISLFLHFLCSLTGFGFILFSRI